MKKEKSEYLVPDLPEIDYESTEDRAILRGKYMGEDILIYYYGESGHPCAYLKVKGDENSVYYENDEPCHGGITFSNYVDEDSKRAEGRFDKGYWIGRDYGHLGDYTDYMKDYPIGDMRKWTTEDILIEVVEQILEFRENGYLISLN